MTFPLILGIIQIGGALIITLSVIWANKRTGEKWNFKLLMLIILMIATGLMGIIEDYVVKHPLHR
jgi:hypothetical protein